MKRIYLSLLTLATLTFIACGGGQSTEEHSDDMQSEEAHSEHDGHDHGNMGGSSMSQVADVPAGSRVFFKNLQDGQAVTSPLHIEMGAEGITVHPAGEVIEGTGHHHILVDEGATEKGGVVPADEKHIHFGGGQTEYDLTLEPGSHQLTLQFADGLHRSYGPELSATITVTVK